MALHRLLVPLVLLVLLAAAAAKPLEPCPGSCRCFLSEGLKRADCRQVPEWADQQSDAQDVRILPPAAGRGARSHALHLTHFDVFPKVLQLSVTNRGLAELIPSGFHGLHSLQELDVSNNLLERFNYKVFKRMPALRRLILAGNPIILEPGVPFIASKSLLSLDLGHCDVVNVPKGSLDGLRNLTDLSLRGNPLRLQKGRPLLGSPRGLAKLAVLDLSACGLEALPAGVLDMLTGLRRLYLDGNSLHTVERGVLPRGLRHLDLSANLIRDPPTAVITALNLTKLELSDNPVHCTCAFVGLQAWLSGRPVMMERPVICAEPAQYRGVSWTKVDEQQLCSDEAKQANTSESSSSSDESSSADDDYESSSTSSLVVGDDSLPNDDDSLELPPASYEVYTHENNAIDGAPPRPAAILKLPGSQRAVSHNDISFYQADQPADTTPPPAEDDEPAAKGDDDAAAEEEDDAAAKDDDESGAEDEDSDRGSTRDREELETERPPPLGAEVEINKDAETLFSNADTIAMGTHEEAAVKAPEDHEAAESGVVGGEVQDLHAGDSATTVAPDPATETVSEAVPEAAAEAIPETVHESIPESVTETEAVPAATPEAVPEAALEAAAQATAVADPVTEVVTEAPPEAVPAAATTDAATEAAPGTQEGDVAATDAPSPDAEPAQPAQPAAEGQGGQETTTTPEGVLVSADRADHARALGEPEAGQLPDSAVGEVPQDVDAKGGGSDVVVPPAVEPSSAPTTPAAGGEPELTTPAAGLAPVVEEAVVPVVAKNIVGEENDDDAPSKAEAAPAVPEIVEPAIVPDTADEVAAEPKPTPAAIPEAPAEAATETLLPDVAVAADLPEDAKHNEELAVEKVPGTALAGDSGPVELQKSTITYVILGCIVATMIVLVLYALLRSKAKKTDAKQNGVRRENGDARAHLPEGTELKDMMNPLLGTAATADPEAPRRTSLTSLELIREEGEDTETTRLQQAADDHDSPAASQTPKPEKPVRATPEATRRQPAANGKPNGKPANGQPSNGKLSADTAPTTPGQQRAADQPSRVTVKAGVIPTPMPRTPVLVTRNGANGTKVNGIRNT